jgi:hypothetical protein
MGALHRATLFAGFDSAHILAPMFILEDANLVLLKVKTL